MNPKPNTPISQNNYNPYFSLQQSCVQLSAAFLGMISDYISFVFTLHTVIFIGCVSFLAIYVFVFQHSLKWGRN